MVRKKKFKFGFSLAEALVVMAIVAVFFAVASKIVTTKPKTQKQVNMHGYFECVYNGSSLSQTYMRQGVLSNPESVSVCTFEPPTGVAYFNINTSGPIYYAGFQPNISHNLNISITVNVDNSNPANPVTTGSITLSSPNGSLTLGNNNTQEEALLFFSTIYPDSRLYNGGAMRHGIMISW